MPDKHEPLEKYVRSRQIELGISLEPRKAVYLDIKFWIILRDIELGLRAEARELEFLSELRRCVCEGKIFCPISDATFGELLKNARIESRMAVATLIDELSLNVTLLPYHMRVGTELAHLLHSARTPENVYPLRHLSWSRPAYILGFMHPTKTAFGSEQELLIQKSFFDHMWALSLKEMIELIGGQALPDLDMFTSLAAKLNLLNGQHVNELRTFEQTYRAEVHGVIDVFLDEAIAIVDQMVRSEYGPGHELSGDQRREQGRQLHNLLFAALEKPETKIALPTMNVIATIFAAVRWNRYQRLKSNDFLDFQHAAAALGYCDAFLTERPLAALITAAHTGLDWMYGCTVMSSTEAAVAYLKAV